MKLYQIADIIEFDPRSVSKEVKRNRTPIDEILYNFETFSIDNI